ncbi:MAG: succinyldiaminopimelate transaminase [Propionibacteriaceae bacterium]|jgi:succinyldiaminopimelate transaminase|nr:succinyldiaminopimelate transaminase [Propionibacteriaceae bacterium]
MRLWAPPLPEFPWDTIAADVALARSHPDGACDLSVGTPVDPTPKIGQRALAGAADAHGYPEVWGTPALRAAVCTYVTTRWGAPEPGERSVLPVIGAKELVAWLPILAGVRPGDTVVIPEIAYPTYAVGATMAGARVVTATSPAEVEHESPVLVWTNSPSNPTGRVDRAAEVRAWIEYARAKGALLAADECYGEFGWEAEPVSVLDARVNGGTLDGLLGVYSLSKRSNLAGYRAGFVVGDSEVVQALLGLRKHLGMMVAAPVLAAMTALLHDQTHVDGQRTRYAARRAVLSKALVAAGFVIDCSEAGLYLWATRGEPGRRTARWLAERGIIVAPGDFYGDAGARHVRIALTATDERIAAAAARLG